MMKEIHSELMGGNRIKVTWEISHGWLSRIFMGIPKTSEVTATYRGSGTVWHVLPSYQRVSTSLESRLADIEMRLRCEAAQ